MFYVSFIDDFSHKTWIYLLKKKDEVFTWFKEFMDHVENQKGNHKSFEIR